MPFDPPDHFNIADYFLHDRLREGMGERTAIVTAAERVSYAELAARAHQYASVLRRLGVQQEQRVIVALPDGPDYAAALFGILELGAVVVMVNPFLPAEEVAYFYGYSRARVAIVGSGRIAAFEEAAGRPTLLVVGQESGDHPHFESLATEADRAFELVATHKDDPAIWLFSGGTTGKPKAVVQTHTAFANTTELYAKGVIGYRPDDVTISVPKLFFGYATGSNLLFPMAVGATSVLFDARCTPDELLAQIARHRPTILINVPTMINQLLAHDGLARADLSCLRLATSAGEALPVTLHERWAEATGVDLLDGLGTAEMWHIFLSNRPGQARPGTLGQVVPGFEIKLCDADGNEVGTDEMGTLWVRGNSRAIGYWQQHQRSCEAFCGEWYVSSDLLRRDADGFYTYGGRADDMLKVKGKWLAPKEVENCLLGHPAVREAAVVGVPDGEGLTRPWGFVIARAAEGLEQQLIDHVASTLASYKAPTRVVVKDAFARTHLGKVDRGALRREATGE